MPLAEMATVGRITMSAKKSGSEDKEYTKGVWGGRDVGIVAQTQKQVNLKMMRQQGVTTALNVGHQMS